MRSTAKTIRYDYLPPLNSIVQFITYYTGENVQFFTTLCKYCAVRSN